MASFDFDYELIAIYNRKSDDKFSISKNDLDSYLIPKNNKAVSKDEIEKTMRWIAYTKSPTGYIFEKI